MCVCVYVCVHVYVKRVYVHVRCRTTSTARRKVVSAKRQFIEFVRLGQGIVRKNEMSLFHRLRKWERASQCSLPYSQSVERETFHFSSPHKAKFNLSLSLSLVSSYDARERERERERGREREGERER